MMAVMISDFENLVASDCQTLKNKNDILCKKPINVRNPDTQILQNSINVINRDGDWELKVFAGEKRLRNGNVSGI